MYWIDKTPRIVMKNMRHCEFISQWLEPPNKHSLLMNYTPLHIPDYPII